MRPVRLGGSAFDDLEAQLPVDRLDDFRRHDLRPVLEALSDDDAVWDEIAIPHGPGRRLSLVFTNPNRRIEYTSNGEVRQEFSVVYSGRPIGGEATLNDEATAVEWFAPADLDDLTISAEVRKRIARHLSGEEAPYLG